MATIRQKSLSARRKMMKHKNSQSLPDWGLAPVTMRKYATNPYVLARIQSEGKRQLGAAIRLVSKQRRHQIDRCRAGIVSRKQRAERLKKELMRFSRKLERLEQKCINDHAGVFGTP